MRFNPNAIMFWLIGACIGFLCSGITGAVTGLLICLIIGFISSFL
jgi:hypothetical protein